MTIRCDAVTPPDCADEAVFSAESYAKAKLILPEASLSAYSKAQTWKKFQWWLNAGVESVEIDEAPAEYYNLQGFPVSADRLTTGQPYVRRQGGKSKVIIPKLRKCRAYPDVTREVPSGTLGTSLYHRLLDDFSKSIYRYSDISIFSISQFY